MRMNQKLPVGFGFSLWVRVNISMQCNEREREDWIWERSHNGFTCWTARHSVRSLQNWVHVPIFPSSVFGHLSPCAVMQGNAFLSFAFFLPISRNDRTSTGFFFFLLVIFIFIPSGEINGPGGCQLTLDSSMAAWRILVYIFYHGSYIVLCSCTKSKK